MRWRNFMSFGNNWSKIDLTGRGTTLIVGENLDEGGSSGAGKTTVLSALSFCLYDKIPADVSKDRLINTTNEKKNTYMEVELFFSKGDEHFKVRRYRGGRTGVNLYKLLNDGEQHNPTTVELDGVFYNDVTPDSSRNFNLFLEDLIGFSYDLFAMIVLFSGNDRSFLSKSVGDQRKLIEELFKITALSKKAKSLKTLITQTDKDIEVEKVVIKQTELRAEEQKRHFNEQVARCEKWDTQRVIDLDRMSKQIEELMAVDFAAEETKFELLKNLEAESSPIEQKVSFKKTERQMLNGQKSPKVTERALLNQNITENENVLKKLDKELKHLIDAKCPYCLQDYTDAQNKIAEKQSLSEQIQQDLITARSNLITISNDIDTFDKNLALDIEVLDKEIADLLVFSREAKQKIIDLKETFLFPNINSLITAKNQITSISNRLEEMENETNPHLDAAAALINEKQIVVTKDRLDELIKNQEDQKFLLKLLTDKNSFIRKNIISKTIPFLNKRIAYYTEKLNLPHIVLFQPDMTCDITQYGRELDHGNLSSGEKKKLNISLCLSFRDVLTYLHSKVNVLLTDEIDGGSISGQDVDSLISLLKHKAWDEDISVFVVSHRPEFEGRCDKNIIVRKEGGFSSLITQI